MDDKLVKALEFANYRQTLNNQLHKVKVKTDGALIYSTNGGTFKINQTLICFLDYLIRQNITESVILDDNNNPVYIENISSFLDKITSIYFEVTNDYLSEYKKIQKSRNIKSILDIKDI